MSVSGTCEIGMEREAKWNCDRCGQLVCDKHYDEGLGYCTECAADVTQPGEPTSDDDDDEWRDGVDTHEME